MNNTMFERLNRLIDMFYLGDNLFAENELKDIRDELLKLKKNEKSNSITKDI